MDYQEAVEMSLAAYMKEWVKENPKQRICQDWIALEARLQLAEKVAEYGRHLITCGYGMDDDQPCTCGYQEASRKLRAWKEEVPGTG